MVTLRITETDLPLMLGDSCEGGGDRRGVAAANCVRARSADGARLHFWQPEKETADKMAHGRRTIIAAAFLEGQHAKIHETFEGVSCSVINTFCADGGLFYGTSPRRRPYPACDLLLTERYCLPFASPSRHCAGRPVLAQWWFSSGCPAAIIDRETLVTSRLSRRQVLVNKILRKR